MRIKLDSQAGGRRLIYAVVSLVVLAALAGGAAYAWIGRHVPIQDDAAPERVVIATIVYAGSCPVIAAQAKGYFTSEGIQAAIPAYTSGKASLDAVLAGQADLGLVADLPVMFAVMDHRPLSVVATVAKTENDHGIVGRKDRGVTSPANLQGKRIGVAVGTSAHFVLDVLLTRYQLSARDVIVRDLKPEALSRALAMDEIDVASTWEPNLGKLQSQLGGNGTTFVIGDIYKMSTNLVGTQAYVASHEKTLEKVLRAMMHGARFCEESPNEARELVAASVKVDAADLKASWSDNRFHVTLDQSLLLELEDETRWAVKNRLTGRADMPNYLGHLHLDTLQAVAPAAVTVIHERRAKEDLDATRVDRIARGRRRGGHHCRAAVCQPANEGRPHQQRDRWRCSQCSHRAPLSHA
jgi:NitT/TauT family transport system substrate-binding protein